MIEEFWKHKSLKDNLKIHINFYINKKKLSMQYYFIAQNIFLIKKKSNLRSVFNSEINFNSNDYFYLVTTV